MRVVLNRWAEILSMSSVTLESLAQRVEALERIVHSGIRPPTKDWRSVIGHFEDSELSRAIDEAAAAIRAEDRQSVNGDAS